MPNAVLRMAMLLVFLAASAASGGELVAIPGTAVSLVPPPGFVPAERFAGLQNDELGASILVNDIPGPYAEIVRDFTADGFAKSGMKLGTSEEATIAGRAGRLLFATQTAEGVPFEKWMAAFGDESATVLLVANYPEVHAARLREPLRAAVLSAVWKRDAKLDPFEGLRFRVRESANLKIKNRMQNMLLLARPGQDLPVPTAEPFAVVGASHSPVQIDDLAGFARQRVTSLPQITGVTGVVGKPVEIGGRRAYELTARAKDAKSGDALAVYQLILTSGDDYYMVVGLVGEAAETDFLPEFREIASSLEVP